MQNSGSIFDPKPDITTYELAKILAIVLNSQSSVFLPEFMATFPDEVLRHFTDREPAIKTFLLTN